jgi:hypothetical protein
MQSRALKRCGFGFGVRISGGSERELAMDVLIRPGLAMRAACTAGFGAGAESLVNDGLDGARASATFRAAAQTSVDLLGITRQVFSGVDSVTDVVVADEVAGTDNHETQGPFGDARPFDIQDRRGMQKEKASFQVIPK